MVLKYVVSICVFPLSSPSFSTASQRHLQVVFGLFVYALNSFPNDPKIEF